MPLLDDVFTAWRARHHAGVEEYAIVEMADRLTRGQDKYTNVASDDDDGIVTLARKIVTP